MRISFNDLFEESGHNASTLINDADAILGIDRLSSEQIVLFGREVLKQFQSLSRTCTILEVVLDTRSDELERLLAFVKLHKGHHEFRNE